MTEPGRWLQDVSLFAPLSDDQLAILDRAMVLQEHPPGHIFMRQGQRSGNDLGLYVLRSGSVTISVAKPRGGFALIRTLEEGEVFGLIGLIDPEGARTATVVAGSSVEVAHLSRAAFLTLFHAHHQLASAFQLVLARQLIDDLAKTDEALRTALSEGGGLRQLACQGLLSEKKP